MKSTKMTSSPCLGISRFILLLLVYSRSMEGCEEGWDMFGEHCYLFSDDNYSWEDAKVYCEAVGGSLVKIEDEPEDVYVRRKLSDETRLIFKPFTNIEKNDRYAWIGARHFPEYNEHRWVDGTKMTYNGWAPGRPGSDEGCVDYLKKFNYRWNSHCDCKETKGPFICEKGCQEGWRMFGNKCYLFSETTHSWEDAKANCETNDGNLIIVDTQAEHEYVRQRVSGSNIESAWIGARFDVRTGGHRWIDGTSISVNGWGPGQPGNTKGCVEYLSSADSLWTSKWDCANEKSSFICEKRCDVGWEKFGNRCYLLSRVYRGWEDAKSYCESIGSTLVKVANDLEHRFVRQKISDANLTYAWIGARFDPSYSEHRWVDSSQLTFSRWAPGLPGNSTGCVNYLRKFDYLWNSHCDCSRTRGAFMCQKELKPLYSFQTTDGEVLDFDTETIKKSEITYDTMSSYRPSSTTSKTILLSVLTQSTEGQIRIEAPPTPRIDASMTSVIPDTGLIGIVEPPTVPGIDRPVTSVVPVTEQTEKPGISRIEQTADGLTIVCLPNDTIYVHDLPPNSHGFAVQNVSGGDDVVCVVSNIDNTTMKITGCKKDLSILFTYGSYADLQTNKVHGGKSVTSGRIMCREIADSGVVHSINDSYSAVLVIDSDTDIVPTYEISSHVNATETTVGDPIEWTISFPEAYVLEVSECTAEPGTLNRPDMKISLISKGGCNLAPHLITNFTENSNGSVVAIVSSFMFYNDDTVDLKCEVMICPDVQAHVCDTTCSRQKRDVYDRAYLSTEARYSASVKTRLHVTSGVSKLGTTTTTTTTVMATFQLTILLFVLL